MTAVQIGCQFEEAIDISVDGIWNFTNENELFI
jgi:hypothetical protein